LNNIKSIPKQGSISSNNTFVYDVKNITHLHAKQKIIVTQTSAKIIMLLFYRYNHVAVM